MNRNATTPSIAPSFRLSPADKAAQLAARGSIRTQASDEGGWFPFEPNGSGMSPAGREALRRRERDTARIRSEQVGKALKERGMAEYYEYVEAAA